MTNLVQPPLLCLSEMICYTSHILVTQMWYIPNPCYMNYLCFNNLVCPFYRDNVSSYFGFSYIPNILLLKLSEKLLHGQFDILLLQVLSRSGKTEVLTNSHRPYGRHKVSLQEIKRIREAGGWVGFSIIDSISFCMALAVDFGINGSNTIKICNWHLIIIPYHMFQVLLCKTKCSSA